MLSYPSDQLCRQFTRAVSRYDEVAILQTEVQARLLDRLQWVRLNPSRILDLGCGTGHALKSLSKMYTKAYCLGLDLSLPMVRAARKQKPRFKTVGYLAAQGQNMPFSDNSLDMVFCHQVLPWVGDPDAFFKEIQRVIKPGGLFMFSSLGPDTLKEVRAAWAEIETVPHVHPQMDMHDIGDALVRQGWQDPVMDTEFFSLTYENMMRLFRDLRDSGSTNIHPQRRKTLTGKKRFEAFRHALKRTHAKDTLLSITVEVVYGHAWAADQTGVKADQEGVVKFPLSSLLNKRKKVQ